MQAKKTRISNQERSDATRAALIAAARQLFVDKGYADTGTPEIVAATGVTRGALYHHFNDKADLFLAVARQAAEEVSDEISREFTRQRSPLDALILGARRYFAAMSENGRSRLLLLDAPSILNPAQLLERSDLAGAKELRLGLESVLPPTGTKIPLDELTAIVSSAFDRAALAIANGESERRYKAAITFLLKRIAE
jgi:AcrR family transcriptional regulator